MCIPLGRLHLDFFCRNHTPRWIRLVSLCHACFIPAFIKGLKLDVSVVSLFYNMPLYITIAAPQTSECLNRSGVFTEWKTAAILSLVPSVYKTFKHDHKTSKNLDKFFSPVYLFWVKALRYWSGGLGIDSQWCHWGFFFLGYRRNRVPWGRLSL
jgi:hypothetical protein